MSNQILKTKYCNLSLAFSKNIFIDKAKKINLTKPIVLGKLLSKFELKAKFIKKESHRKNKAKKSLFLKMIKFLS